MGQPQQKMSQWLVISIRRCLSFMWSKCQQPDEKHYLSANCQWNRKLSCGFVDWGLDLFKNSTKPGFIATPCFVYTPIASFGVLLFCSVCLFVCFAFLMMKSHAHLFAFAHDPNLSFFSQWLQVPILQHHIMSSRSAAAVKIFLSGSI